MKNKKKSIESGKIINLESVVNTIENKKYGIKLKEEKISYIMTLDNGKTYHFNVSLINQKIGNHIDLLKTSKKNENDEYSIIDKQLAKEIMKNVYLPYNFFVLLYGLFGIVVSSNETELILGLMLSLSASAIIYLAFKQKYSLTKKERSILKNYINKNESQKSEENIDIKSIQKVKHNV